MNEKPFKHIWNPIDLSGEHRIRFQFGPLDVRIKRVGDELTIGWRYDRLGETRLSLDTEPARWTDDVDWKRWVGGAEFDRLIFKPIMPDRPIVVRPEMPVSLLPKETAMFFVGVPSFISVCVGKHEKQLCDIPTSILSNTWFGETTVDGALCYGLKTTAKREHNQLLNHPFRVICPIRIKNASSEILDIESLCLPVKHLSVYLGETRLWGNQETVEFRGNKKWGRITSSPGSPPFDGVSGLLSSPRDVSHADIVFNVFRKLIPFHNG
ncbi:MAG: hypothetical protein RRC34_00180 [Lentisphaeria bacterium]|nr:hypothetical protein [Lentisphaeria bacterium]